MGILLVLALSLVFFVWLHQKRAAGPPPGLGRHVDTYGLFHLYGGTDDGMAEPMMALTVKASRKAPSWIPTGGAIRTNKWKV